MNKGLSAQGRPASGGKVLGIIVLVVVFGAGGWFLVAKQSQKKIEVKNESQQEGQQVVKEGSQKQGEEKVKELETEDIDTSSWKTYRNEEFGFEVKYPEEWEVESNNFGVTIAKYRNPDNPNANTFFLYDKAVFAPSEVKDDFVKYNATLKSKITDWMIYIQKNSNYKDRVYSDIMDILGKQKCQHEEIVLVDKNTLYNDWVNNERYQIILYCGTNIPNDAKVLNKIFQTLKFIEK